MTQVLALDVGTSSVRADRFDASATESGNPAKRHYVGETDPERVVAAVRETLDEAGGFSGVDAVGASCFGHSLLALDDAGRPLTAILGWRDTRSADAADWLAGRLDAAAVHARTGCYIHTSYWPAKLAWLAKVQPETFRAARRFVSFCDYLYLRLLGREVPSSLSMASGTGLFDLGARRWDEELLQTLGTRHGAAACDRGRRRGQLVSRDARRSLLERWRRVRHARPGGADDRNLGRVSHRLRVNAAKATARPLPVPARPSARRRWRLVVGRRRTCELVERHAPRSRGVARRSRPRLARPHVPDAARR